MKSVRSPGLLGILGLAFGSLGGFFAPALPGFRRPVSRRYRMNKLRGRSARRRRDGPLRGPGSKWETEEDRARWLGANGPRLDAGVYADIPQ